MNFLRVIVIFYFLSTSFYSSSQNVVLDSLATDSIRIIKKERIHSPTKATLLSTFIPGAGQVYNKKYWKVPIVFATIGTSMYFAISNHKHFKDFKQAYLYRIDDDPLTIDEYVDVLSEEGLRGNMDYHQRNRDLSYIFAGLFYVFNIVDAAVDAHLFNFPKNDKLSFNLHPTINYTANNHPTSGFTLIISL